MTSNESEPIVDRTEERPHSHRWWLTVVAAALATFVVGSLLLLSTQTYGQSADAICGVDTHAHTAAATTTPLLGWPFDFFTNSGHYMPRTHCLIQENGQPDWPWIAALMVLTSGIVVGYLRIFIFWRRAYLAEAAEDRNRKLMQLAYIFLFCAVCGYAMALLMYVWPAYRLLVIFLIALNVFTWQFAMRLSGFRISLSANRLQRQLHEAELSKAQEINAGLAKVTAHYRALMSAVPDLFFVKSLQGAYIDCNEAFLTFTGFSREKLIGCTDNELFGEAAHAYQEDDQRAIREGQTRFEEWVTNAEGERVLLETVKSVAYDEEGGPLGLSCLSRDITERHARAQELAEAKNLAESANIAKSSFLANMSHEMRTPLTAVIGYSELLEGDPAVDDPPKRREWCSTIRESANHLLTLIGDVLDISKIEAGRITVERRGFDPIATLQELVSVNRVAAINKGLQLDMEWRSKLPSRITNDPTRFRQVIFNLLSNATKFTTEGRVVLTSRFEPTPGADDGSGWLRVEVTDTGVGMTPEQRARVFEPFTQADASVTRRFGGTGLGLSISNRLCELMGGTLEVESEPARGSTFTATFATGPLTPEMMVETPSSEAVDDWPSRSRQLDAPAPKVPQLAGRVLITDDGPINRMLIRLLLERAGIEVSEAENGQEALMRVLGGDPFDLVLMDMQMPVMDGYEAVRQIREAGLDIPVVALTAHALAEDRQRCLSAGCDEYLAKPILSEDLISTVGQWLNAATPE